MASMKNDFSSLTMSSLPPLEGAWNAQSSPNRSRDTNSLFSVNSMNMINVSQVSHTLEIKPKYEKKEFESLSDMLERRQREILEQVVQKERKATRQRMEEMEEERLLQDWEEEKVRFLSELVGDRVLGGSSKSSVPVSTSLSTITTLPVSNVQASDLHAIAQSHVQLVARWNREPDMNVAEEFSRIATPTKSPAYAMAWKLITATEGRSTPMSIATGTLAHLSRQFQAYVINRVQNASLAGQDISLPSTFPSGMPNTVATFVKLEHGSSASVWTIIYYCIRCGDAVAAMKILDMSVTQVESSIRNVVNSMAQVQGSSLCMWDTSMARIDRRAVLENKPRSPDIYEEACWTLLSLSEKIHGAAVKTIEDYIFASLWYAVQQPRATDLLIKLGQSIVDFGPKYFDEFDEEGGWAYATPLLLTQQYRTALTHLAKVGASLGLLQATHLGMSMGEIHDLGDVISGEENVLTVLLIEFSSQLQIADATAALEYLVRIPNPDRKRKEIARLLVETRQFESLAGTLTSDGVRNGTGSALSHHFEPADIHNILEEGADLSIIKNNPRDAMEMLNLAERYDTLLQLLNEVLVGQVNQLPGSEVRESWRMTAQAFHAMHLESRRTHVMDFLTKRNKMSFVQTFRTLLRLFDFFDALTRQDYTGAWTIVVSLSLLPSSMSDLQAKENEFRSIDPLLKDVLPDVFLGAMKALYHQHEYLKSSGLTANKGTIMQHVTELRTRSSTLMSFAGRLNLKNANDQLATMAKMEAAMV